MSDEVTATQARAEILEAVDLICLRADQLTDMVIADNVIATAGFLRASADRLEDAIQVDLSGQANLRIREAR